MFKWLCLLLLLACFTLPAHAQDIEAFAGYSYLRTTGAYVQHASLNGWNVELSANVRSWGVVADFSGHYGGNVNYFIPIGEDGRGLTFLFGPQYSFRKVPRVTPFVHALFGGVQAEQLAVVPAAGGACPAPGCSSFPRFNETDFAMAFGGGIDFKVRDHVWIRAIQVDYVRQNFSSATMNSPRISAGIVYRFGKK